MAASWLRSIPIRFTCASSISPSGFPTSPSAAAASTLVGRAMHQYQEHLSRLLERETPGILHNPCVKRALLPETAAKARGKTLKRLDDTLDGLTCALAAWLLWKDPSAWELIGDLNGYMMVPRDQAASAAPRA